MVASVASCGVFAGSPVRQPSVSTVLLVSAALRAVHVHGRDAAADPSNHRQG
jgi:hypothetical protein